MVDRCDVSDGINCSIALVLITAELYQYDIYIYTYTALLYRNSADRSGVRQMSMSMSSYRRGTEHAPALAKMDAKLQFGLGAKNKLVWF
jgi:hypothetical protein